MKTILFAGMCIVLFGATSCKSKRFTAAELARWETAYMKLYDSDDYRVAEKGLLEYRQQILNWQKAGMLLDYNFMLTITDARLYNLYRHTGNDKAKGFYVSCTNYWSKGAMAHTGTVGAYSEEKVLELVNQVDGKRQVLWKEQK